MPTGRYDGGTNGVDRTSKKYRQYTVTKGPTVATTPQRTRNSADAMDTRANALRRQGYGYWQTDGANRDANSQFAYDPQYGRYRTSSDYMPTPSLSTLATQPAGPGGPGGGGGGGGYGGGGGGAALNPADYQGYAAAMMKVINSVKPPAALQSPLTGMIDPAVDRDVANARSAYAGIASQVPTVDPYLDLIARQAPQMTPEYEQFLRGQGVPTGEYGQAVGYANAQLSAGDQNWANLARILGQNHVAGQQSTVDTARLQGENIAQGLEGQRTQLQALAALQQLELDKAAQAQAYAAQQERARAIMELITAGLPYGAQPDLTGVV